MTDSDEITPVRRQYLQIKRQYPDAILFFRLGDFYETFDQDAETTARELDIVLMSRKVSEFPWLGYLTTPSKITWRG
jgi:DNA mismatch repair protein MutS